MRSPLFILLATFVLSLLIAQQFGGMRPDISRPTSAVTALYALLQQQPALGQALAEADRGDNGALMAWLNAAHARERKALAEILKDLPGEAEHLTAADLGPRVDAAYYRYRHRFRAFVNIPTGEPELDAELDNLMAYISVAGTPTPSAEDVALAKHLLPRLEQAVARKPSSAVWDTIGCVRYVAGDTAGARAAFEQAVTLGERELAKASDAQRAVLEHALPLYRVRRQAAIDADLRAVEERGTPTPRPALPLTPETPQPEKP